MVCSGQKLFLKNVLGVSNPILNFQPSFISGPQRDSFCMLCPSSVLESYAFHLTLLGEGWQECPLCSLSSLGLGQPLFPGSQRWDCSVILSHMFGFFPPPLTLLPAHIRETRLIYPFSVTNLPLFFLREGGPQLSFMFFGHMDCAPPPPPGFLLWTQTPIRAQLGEAFQRRACQWVPVPRGCMGPERYILRLIHARLWTVT